MDLTGYNSMKNNQPQIDILKTIEVINENIPIADVISHETSTQVREGTNTQIKCFFHSDNTPSMTVYPGTRGCHCWGCRKSWTSYSFVRDYRNQREGRHSAIQIIHIFVEEYGLKPVYKDKDEPDTVEELEDLMPEIASYVNRIKQKGILCTDKKMKAIAMAITRAVETGNLDWLKKLEESKTK